ncbi:MAG: hypothetical protein AB8C02_12525 [Halioglobus sp.]
MKNTNSTNYAERSASALHLLCFLAVLIALTLWKNPAAAQMPDPEKVMSVSKLKVMAKSISKLREQIPPQYLSPESVAEINDYEPEQIAGWVKQNIQFTPSPGYQLSPEMTLQTATGNALEQAQLLQTVLVQAGLEVRLAQATLSTEQANTLLRESFIKSPARQWQLDAPTREDYYQQLAVELGLQKNALIDRYTALKNLTAWPESGVYSEAQTLATEISTAIKALQNGQTPTSETLLQPFLANAQEYYFVKYRFAQGEPWQEAHPAFSSSVPSIDNSKYLTQPMDQYHHKVTLQAFITREAKGKKQTIPVSPLHKTTVAELLDQQVHFATTPSGMPKAIEERSLASLESGQIFAPSINGKVDPNARLFSLDGSDYSLGEISSSVSALSTATNKKVGGFTQSLEGALGTKADQSSASGSHLLRYFLSITWSAPNGQERSIERTIYSKQAEQSPAQALEAITQRAVLAASASVLTPAAEMHAGLDTMHSAFTLLAKLNAEQYTQAQVFDQMNGWANQRKDLLFQGAAKISAEAAAKQRLFSQAPVLAIKWERRNGASSSMTARKTFDYLINAAQVATLDGQTIEISYDKTLAYGVWSTYSEALLLSNTDQRNALPEKSESAANTFNNAISGQGFSVLTTANQKTNSSTQAPRIPAHLTDAIASNPQHLFVVPKGSLGDTPLAYYAVDARTGEALGYTLDGRGSSTEYAVFLSNLGSSIYAGIKMLACIVKGDAEGEQLSCLGCATLQLAISLIGGAYLSAEAAIAGEGAGEVICNF